MAADDLASDLEHFVAPDNLEALGEVAQYPRDMTVGEVVDDPNFKAMAMAAAYESGAAARRQLMAEAANAGLFRRVLTSIVGAESADTHIIDLLIARQIRKKAGIL